MMRGGLLEAAVDGTFEGAFGPCRHAESGGVFAGEQGGAGGGTHGGRGVGGGEKHPFAGEAVDVRGGVQVGSVTPEIPGSEIIGEDEDDVGTRGGPSENRPFRRCQRENKEEEDGPETHPGG